MDLLHVTFYFEPGLGLYHGEKRLTFWSSPEAREWFKARGYTLYERCWDLEEVLQIRDTSIPAIAPQANCGEAVYPYPHFDTDEDPSQPGMPLRAQDMTGKVGFAQDVLGRHVAVKIVHADTDEYRILRFLHEQSLDTLRENSIIPVLELIPNGAFWFAVMPRWAVYIDRPEPEYIHEIVFIVHSLLKGLHYLHANNIVHGDIHAGNLLVNHITDDCIGIPRRGHLRAEKRLLYALFDFDLSIIPPPGTDINDFRLPAERSYGSFN
ncbi:hypothetical protein JR316_0009669 [Psilocybe cubensis]|uniref:Uncharacterized protein n=1 Tax=Psilocybe cubensis TaxID=181762 RepID=A0ACB8GP67_PSICU|nr:hypothetical protein JR316_0009669 [Psilocybe cubensis]KAH9477456.1 hypothetical protein JR316_0009669 [Psilocybe cubensis]